MKGIFGLPPRTAVIIIIAFVGIVIMFTFLAVFFPGVRKFIGNIFHAVTDALLGRLGFG